MEYLDAKLKESKVTIYFGEPAKPRFSRLFRKKTQRKISSQRQKGD